MENFFTIRQLAFLLKVHHLTIRRYIREKKLLAIKIGGVVRIKEEDLKNFQKSYSSREVNQGINMAQAVKLFSFDDPLWKLDSLGTSLSIPSEE